MISEQEQQGEAIMSEDFLSQVIRSYGKVVPGFMANYLEQSLKMFMTQQRAMRGQVKRVVGVDPVVAVTDLPVGDGRPGPITRQFVGRLNAAMDSTEFGLPIDASDAQFDGS